MYHDITRFPPYENRSQMAYVRVCPIRWGAGPMARGGAGPLCGSYLEAAWSGSKLLTSLEHTAGPAGYGVAVPPCPRRSLPGVSGRLSAKEHLPWCEANTIRPTDHLSDCQQSTIIFSHSGPVWRLWQVAQAHHYPFWDASWVKPDGPCTWLRSVGTWRCPWARQVETFICWPPWQLMLERLWKVSILSITENIAVGTMEVKVRHHYEQILYTSSPELHGEQVFKAP